MTGRAPRSSIAAPPAEPAGHPPTRRPAGGVSTDSVLRGAPVVPLFGPLLARGSFPDVRPRRAATPPPESEDEQAHDEDSDPDQEEDEASFVDVESRGLGRDGKPHDGADDHKHDAQRHQTYA